MKHWEIIADNLSNAGWSWGCVATVDSKGRTIFVADAHRGDGQRFVVHADEKLTAFLELEKVTRPFAQNIWDLRPPISVELSRGQHGNALERSESFNRCV